MYDADGESDSGMRKIKPIGRRMLTRSADRARRAAAAHLVARSPELLERIVRHAIALCVVDGPYSLPGWYMDTNFAMMFAKRDLLTGLSLVNKFFNELCQPLLWETISVMLGGGRFNIKTLRQLEEKPERLAWVRHVNCYKPDPQRTAMAELLMQMVMERQSAAEKDSDEEIWESEDEVNSGDDSEEDAPKASASRYSFSFSAPASTSVAKAPAEQQLQWLFERLVNATELGLTLPDWNSPFDGRLPSSVTTLSLKDCSSRLLESIYEQSTTLQTLTLEGLLVDFEASAHADSDAGQSSPAPVPVPPIRKLWIRRAGRGVTSHEQSMDMDYLAQRVIEPLHNTLESLAFVRFDQECLDQLFCRFAMLDLKLKRLALLDQSGDLFFRHAWPTEELVYGRMGSSRASCWSETAVEWIRYHLEDSNEFQEVPPGLKRFILCDGLSTSTRCVADFLKHLRPALERNNVKWSLRIEMDKEPDYRATQDDEEVAFASLMLGQRQSHPIGGYEEWLERAKGLARRQGKPCDSLEDVMRAFSKKLKEEG